MAERCLSEEVLTMVHAFPDKGRKDAVRALASRIAQLEAVVEAQAKVIQQADELRWQSACQSVHLSYLKDYDAAKAELERVKGQ